MEPDDEGMDQATAADGIRMLLAGHDGITERRMFGTNAFLVHGNLACGPNDESLLVRVGADGMAAALAEPDAEPMRMGERTMGGFVRVELATMDHERLRHWVDVALAVAAALPPK